MFTERQKKILGILKQHRDGITSDEIARLVGVSSKTVRTDIKGIAAELSPDTAVIRVSMRCGYTAEIHDEAAVDALLREQEHRLLEGAARSAYVLERLLMGALTNMPVRQQDLADELYIGLSTLKASLKEAKGALQGYGLSVENYKNRGMMVTGRERELRQAIFNHLFAVCEVRGRVKAALAERIDRKALRQILIRVISSYELVLTDDALAHLLDHAFIALLRASEECNVSYMLRESREIEAQREFAMATAVFEEIYQRLGIDVLTSEIYYLAQHLAASKRHRAEEQPASSYAKELTDAMLRRIYQLVGLDFRQDETLRAGLQTHLESVVPRIRFRIRTKNEVLSVMKNEYPLAFQIGVIAAKLIEARESLAVSEDEIGFLAVHFGAALARQHTDHISDKRRVLIVSGSGMGTAELLIARLEEHFHDALQVEKVLPGYQLRAGEFDHIDCIISTMQPESLPPLPPKDQDKLIVVRHLLNEDELGRIRQKLFEKEHSFALHVEKFFRRECFYEKQSFGTKEEVLTFLTDRLMQSGLMDAETARSVFERESASPTEVGNLVAVPHPMENNTAISAIAVVILERPIVWAEHHVQAIFLISIARAEFYLWEPIFLKLFRYFVKENGIRELIARPDYDRFIYDFKQSF